MSRGLTRLRHLRPKLPMWGKITCLLSVVLVAPFVASFVVGYFFLDLLGKQTAVAYMGDTSLTLKQRLEPIATSMESLSKSASSDILLMGDNSRTQQALSQADIQVLQERFQSFLQRKQAYSEIALLDLSGQEQVKAITVDGKPVVAGGAQLVKYADSSCWKQALALDRDEVAVSDVRLRSDSKGPINTGSPSDPTYMPLITYATPVFTAGGQRSGIIMLTVYADNYFDEIRHFQRPGEQAFLMDSKGYYLANAQKYKEFGNLIGTKESFNRDYPNLVKELLGGYNREAIKWGGKLFTFDCIYPTLGSYAINKGAEKSLGAKPEDGHHWVLVGISSLANASHQSAETKTNFVYFVTISGAIFIVFFGAGAALALRMSSRRSGGKGSPR